MEVLEADLCLFFTRLLDVGEGSRQKRKVKGKIMYC